jgi:hypothetical protein
VTGSPSSDKIQSSITVAQLLESVVDGESIITELDMVDQVFQRVDISLVSGVFFLAVVMAYAESLLSCFIYPHKRLQMFIFDLCVETKNYACLQQLVNFHVILDSNELLDKLTHLEPSVPWVDQAKLDMAKRMKRTDIVIKFLHESGRSDEIIGYLRSEDPQYEIDKLFHILGSSSTDDVHQKIWKQIELWNTSSDSIKPILSHNVVLGSSSCDS